MGILPKDFYPMRSDDFWLMRVGFIKKLVWHERIARKMTVAIVTATGGEIRGDLYDWWPIMFDDQLKRAIREFRISEASRIRLKYFKEKPEKNLIVQPKRIGRIKNTNRG